MAGNKERVPLQDYPNDVGMIFQVRLKVLSTEYKLMLDHCTQSDVEVQKITHGTQLIDTNDSGNAYTFGRQTLNISITRIYMGCLKSFSDPSERGCMRSASKYSVTSGNLCGWHTRQNSIHNRQS